MYKGKRLLAIVPARGGSKGIPHKNIAMVRGKELLSYTLDAAKASQYLDRIVVSTDDEKIAAVARRDGADVIMRPAELAADASRTIDVVLHVLDTVQEAFDYMVLLQPTQPLRRTEHIDSAIQTMIEDGWGSLVSVSPARNHPLLLRKMDEQQRLLHLLPANSTVRRQEFEKYYVVNGAIYINKVSEIGQDTSLNDNEYGYEMPAEDDLDIDEPEDLKLLEFLLQWREQTNANRND